MIKLGDCLEGLRALPDNSVDSIVTDPPYGLSFMGKAWDYDVPPEEVWRECLRVLKPGGHLLCFAGTRTQHRMAVRIEDAGFEIRDMIAWVYGSGFPKSLDVSKAIDRAAGVEGKYGAPKSAAHAGWIERGRMRGEEGHEGFQRPWMEDERAVDRNARQYVGGTEAARRWEGWGTALKPALETVTVARKPLASPGVNVRARVESELRSRGIEGEVRWTSRPANDAASLDPQTSSSSTGARPTGGTSAAPVAASETLSAAKPTASNTATTTLHGAKPTANTSAPTPDARQQNYAPKSSPPMATPAPAVGSERPTSSRSTTSTEAAPLTARRPGGRSTTRSNDSDSQTAIESFAGIATGLTGSWATVRIDRLEDGSFVWPDRLPRKTGGGCTVAANVLAHGTGALNIDACRVGDFQNTTPSGVDRRNAKLAEMGYRPSGYQMGAKVPDTPPGRWPANLIHSGDDEVLAGFPESKDGVAVRHVSGGKNCHSDAIKPAMPDMGYGGRGSAARFFYCAKASKADRDEGLDGLAERKAGSLNLRTDSHSERNGMTTTPRRNTHPTVKPTDLMRYLCRLVTPPGGLVLDPYTGSGSTAKAAALEGFRFIGFEIDPDYHAIAERRWLAAIGELA